MNVIECRKLSKQFGSKTALKELSFTVNDNKIIGFIGRNGAGKTTFLKTCAGFLKPTSGELTLWGEKVFDNLNVISNITFIDEEIQYEKEWELGKILMLGSLYYKHWDHVYAQKLLKHFELNEKLKYSKLSRGMKTQFNIIMGLASRSPLTLMDEPTLGLDAAVRKEFYSILLKDYAENPRTILISSHLLSELENLLEEIVLIHEGSAVLHKPIEEMQEYGIYLNGKKEILLPFIEKKEVFSTEVLGNSVIAGIKNDLSQNEFSYLKENNTDISKISVQDICIYLTKSDRGEVLHEIG
ncbi:MAG: ABC transporter ATP-binding protein [Clostridia bacterium]|nr:ABC transporter ATP-binding protein [Clostridia bacterium]